MLINLDKPPIAVGNVGIQSVGHGKVEIVAEGPEIWMHYHLVANINIKVESSRSEIHILLKPAFFCCVFMVEGTEAPP